MVGEANEFFDLLPEFLEEVHEHLTTIDAGLVQIESALNEQRMVDTDLLNRLFRSAHTIRGSAEFVGMESVEELAGALAELFDFARNGDLTFSLDLVPLAFHAVDHIKAIVENPSSPPEEASHVASTLRNALKEQLSDRVQKSTNVTVSPAGGPPNVHFSISAYTLERKRRKGFFYILTIRPDRHAATAGQSLIEISETLGSLGEVLDTVTLSSPDDVPIVYFLYHTLLPIEALHASLPAIPPEDIVSIPRDHLDTLVTVSEKTTPQERRKRRRDLANDGGSTTSAISHTQEAPEMRSPSLPNTSVTAVEENIIEREWNECTEFVTFFLDKEIYAVPIFLVHDIKEMLPYSRLPNQPPALLGVINLRGNIVPVFDLRRIIGLPPRPFDRKTVLIVLDIGEKMNAIVVDAIRDVATIESHTRQATPLLGREVAAEYAKFIGTDPKNGSFLIVLDIEKAITSVRTTP